MSLINSFDDFSIARNFFHKLPDKNLLKKIYCNQYHHDLLSDNAFADIYLHPYQNSLSVDQLFEYIESANLYFLRFHDTWQWDLGRLLDNELLERAKKLSFRNQCKIIAELDPDILDFEIILSKSKLTRLNWQDDSDLLSTKGKINPTCFLESVSNESYVDLNGALVQGRPLQLLKLIRQNPYKSIGEMPLNWDKSLLAETARSLFVKYVLLLYPLDSPPA